MSEQLDNELKNRINQVFDNYEDTAPAEEGWLLLREKFPEKKKQRILPIWWSAAAVFLLLSILGVWIYTQPTKNNIVTTKPVYKPLDKSEQSAKPQEDTLPNNQTESTLDNGLPAVEQQYVASSGKNLHNSSPTVERVPDGYVYPDKVESSDQLAVNAVTKLSAPTVITLPKNIIKTADSLKQAHYSAPIQQDVLAQQTVKSQQNTNPALKADSAQTTGQSKMSIYLANEQKKEAAKMQKADTKAAADRKVLYSVYAATYFNYAEGSKSQINTGAGVSTDIKLAGNFKLSTGLAIGKNTLNYNSQPVQASITQDAVRAASASASRSGVAYDAVPNPSASQFGFSSLKVLSSPVVSAYNVSLTGLDVPINLKYEFNPAKTDSYISAGLSSGTFITETYNYSYDNSLNALGASPSIPDASVSRSFTRFDFARTLNLSLGMGYQITKGNRLIIEPFLKYPLSGMGSQDIRFGSGGINLRLKFQTAKKK
ncbi:hypothetical protein MUGA111182_11400 [Mucilaginibacter galii]|uniref:Outer membrane protein beta-barrel domain-containing protein n=1 Tax=Mucilaginibacter galii TaxID=2005073 RepID=A0A917J9X6_9SPHI|nr:hypothetical protein [Mucilaginibacter galii]GGI50612.1 hypothetical protein GCM10011425_18240 [Mucilaginibacter galii]